MLHVIINLNLQLENRTFPYHTQFLLLNYFYPQTVNAFQELLKYHYQEVDDKGEWTRLWIRPLLQYLDKNTSVPLEQILSKAISICPDVVKYVLR